MERENRLKKLVRAEKGNVVRFLLVGGCSTLLDFILYRGLLELNLGTIPAKTCSMLVAMVLSFLLNRGWSFRKVNQDHQTQVLRYIVCQAANLCVNVLGNYCWVVLTHNIYVGYVLATGMAMTVNFLLQRFWVFGGKR